MKSSGWSRIGYQLYDLTEVSSPNGLGLLVILALHLPRRIAKDTIQALGPTRLASSPTVGGWSKLFSSVLRPSTVVVTLY